MPGLEFMELKELVELVYNYNVGHKIYSTYYI